MKTSNKILSALLLVLLAMTVFADLLLKTVYLKINLNDPFKNYQPVAIRPFKYLKIRGGNGYAIEIKQGPLNMKVMTKRKNFLTVRQYGDTLIIGFTVVSSMSMRDPESLPRGIIISSPIIAAITVDGSNNILTDWKADSLNLTLIGNAAVNINGADIGKLTAVGNYNTIFNFHTANKVRDLELRLSNHATAILKGIDYTDLSSWLTNDSQLVFVAQAASKLSLKSDTQSN